MNHEFVNSAVTVSRAAKSPARTDAARRLSATQQTSMNSKPNSPDNNYRRVSRKTPRHVCPQVITRRLSDVCGPAEGNCPRQAIDGTATVVVASAPEKHLSPRLFSPGPVPLPRSTWRQLARPAAQCVASIGTTLGTLPVRFASMQ